MRQGLVDELLVYLAPRLLGSEARPLAQLGPIERLQDAPGFALQDVRRIGDDLRLMLRPTAKG